MKPRLLGLVCGVLVGAFAALLFAPSAKAGYDISCWTRSGHAEHYAHIARFEGCDLGGGWWNDNNIRDDSVNEGPDCSGLIFKSWAMVNAWGGTGFYFHDHGDDIHGPYSAQYFRDGCGGACVDVCGSGTGYSCGAASTNTTERMDVFARGPVSGYQYGHVRIVWDELGNGYDHIFEAFDDSAGVDIWQRNYRMLPEYDGVKRTLWGCE